MFEITVNNSFFFYGFTKDSYRIKVYGVRLTTKFPLITVVHGKVFSIQLLNVPGLSFTIGSQK